MNLMSRYHRRHFAVGLVAAVATIAISGKMLADSPAPTPSTPTKDDRAVSDPKADCQALMNSVCRLPSRC